jgi:hypothetical protein
MTREQELLVEIERLDVAKRRALAIADERSRENVALRAALAPFAKIAADYEASDQQSQQHHRDEGRTWKSRCDGHRVSIALGDCRRAAVALQ